MDVHTYTHTYMRTFIQTNKKVNMLNVILAHIGLWIWHAKYASTWLTASIRIVQIPFQHDLDVFYPCSIFPFHPFFNGHKWYLTISFLASPSQGMPNSATSPMSRLPSQAPAHGIQILHLLAGEGGDSNHWNFPRLDPPNGPLNLSI